MQYSSDTTAPASARIWNHWLGGDHHYPVDREAGGAFCQVCPGMVEMARAERAFLVETLTFLAEHRGVRQFLDLGSGLPTENHTHEVARLPPAQVEGRCGGLVPPSRGLDHGLTGVTAAAQGQVRARSRVST